MIRKATLEDVPALAQVHVDSWRDGYKDLLPPDILAALSVEKRAEWWQKVIAHSRDRRVYVAENEAGEIVGFISFGTTRDDDIEHATGEIYALYLPADVWGRGHGRALLETAFQEFQERQYEDVTLWVLHDNERAIGFYNHMGFEIDDAVKVDQHSNGHMLRELRYRYVFSADDS